MQTAFERAFAPSPTFNVYSRDLRPLSLSHCLLLEAVGSPILHDPSATTPDDVLLAAYLCSLPAGAAWQAVNEGVDAPSIQAWGEAWASNAVVGDESSTFARYLEHYLTAPRRWRSGSSSVKTPWEIFVCAGLMRELHLDEAEAWEMPVNRALAYWATTAEHAGDDSILTEDEAQRVDAMEVHHG